MERVLKSLWQSMQDIKLAEFAGQVWANEMCDRLPYEGRHAIRSYM